MNEIWDYLATWSSEEPEHCRHYTSRHGDNYLILIQGKAIALDPTDKEGWRNQSIVEYGLRERLRSQGLQWNAWGGPEGTSVAIGGEQSVEGLEDAMAETLLLAYLRFLIVGEKP